MAAGLTGHQRLSPLSGRLDRRPIDQRFRMVIDACLVQVGRPRSAGRVICPPSAADTMLLPPAGRRACVSRALPREWNEGSRPDR